MKLLLVCVLCVGLQGRGINYDEMDAYHEKIYARMTEMSLRKELLEIGGKQIKSIENPELYAQKAMVAEKLTQFDAKNGTNNWDRAAVHYQEAIELWKAIGRSPDVRNKEAPRRLSTLLLKRANALAKQKKFDDALAVLKEATHADFTERVATLRKEYAKAKNTK